jgi:hypothetical protein
VCKLVAKNLLPPINISANKLIVANELITGKISIKQLHSKCLAILNRAGRLDSVEQTTGILEREFKENAGRMP